MFDKKCEKCGAPATVFLNQLTYFCSEHGFEAVMAAQGSVKIKRVK